MNTMGEDSLTCLIGYVEKKTDIIVARCRRGLKKDLLEIANYNKSDLSKVVNDALEEFVIKAKGKKIVKRTFLRNK